MNSESGCFQILRPERYLEDEKGLLPVSRDSMSRLTQLFSDLISYFSGLRYFSRNKNHSESPLATQILSAISDGILVTDINLRIVEVNHAFTRVTGYTYDEAVNKTPGLLSSGRHGKEFYQRMWDVLHQSGQWQGTIWNRRKNGEVYPQWLSISNLKDKSGTITHYLAVFSDLSQRNSVHNQIHLLAYYDTLTGLPNRELFNDRLKLSLSQSYRDKSKVALFFLDLDGFKVINDTLGHATGDLLLSAVAYRLSNQLRESDTVARLGGDEFTVILSDIHNQSQAKEVAEKILNCFKSSYIIGKRELYINTSIGISLYPDHGNDNETLISHADTAMYQAKQRGKNCHVIYTPDMGIQYKRRITIENDLRVSIADNGFSLVYQPQVEIKSGKISSLEALVRWEQPDIGNIKPDDFLSIAEESGLIIELERWILNTACTQIVSWREKFGLDLCISINISNLHLSTGRLAEYIQDLLYNTRLPPAALEIEITESALMDQRRETIETLVKIKRLGIQIVIDNFGTGFSSLNHIKRFSINRLKIDKSIISELCNEDDDKQLVKTIINMAHNLSLTVSAQGIDNPEQFHYLKMYGCDVAQGFHLFKPVSTEKTASPLLSHTPWIESKENYQTINIDSSLTLE
ncbi:MAG: EAL domain-containing protein [Candidatus Thiodiazotropha sp. (ex Lucinoma borealis)]|nr:EAL domain-containing protein [Candidatus Thiodiazotropha sp. (ex Lucinoma borealis)]